MPDFVAEGEVEAPLQPRTVLRVDPLMHMNGAGCKAQSAKQVSRVGSVHPKKLVQIVDFLVET